MEICNGGLGPYPHEEFDTSKYRYIHVRMYVHDTKLRLRLESQYSIIALDHMTVALDDRLSFTIS